MRIRSTPLLSAGLALLSCVFFVGCRSSQPGPAAPTSAPTTPVIADQGGAPILPDPKMSPGATLPVTRDDICVPGYSKKVRNVPLSVKNQVYAEYGIKSHKPGDYEVDHLISLELGGSNSVKNLWPQSYKTQPWNAHVKDALENELHASVCSGQVDLPTAQHEIATDWIASYKKHFHTDIPLSKTSSGSQRGSRHPLTAVDSAFPDAPAAPKSSQPPMTGAQGTGATGTGGQVWVNLKSGKYFLPGSRYYGKTKQGQYMTKTQAQKQGYVAAQGQ